MAHMKTSMVRHFIMGIVFKNTTVSYHEDTQEAVDDAGEVEHNSHPDRPAVLEEERQQHSLHRALVLVGTDRLQGINVADVGVVGRPVALHAYTDKVQRYILIHHSIISMLTINN